MSTLPFDFVLTKHLTASDSIGVSSLRSSQLIPLDVLQFLHIHLKYRDKKIKYSNEDLVNLQGRFTHSPNSYIFICLPLHSGIMLLTQSTYGHSDSIFQPSLALAKCPHPPFMPDS